MGRGIIRHLLRSIAKPVTTTLSGETGEKKVIRKLNPLVFGKVEHRQINNLTIVDDKGKSHQIDHIEIRQNGIFCIETKNYKGWIFGSENQEKWTQSLYNGEKYQFYNPLKQNKSHIYHLSQLLEKKYRINSVVVMANNNADKIECDNVINLEDLSNYLSTYYDGTNYTIEEMDSIFNDILEVSSKVSRREHIKSIKQTQNGIKNGICPRCGGTLVERTGKYGNFFGCSNYPKCTFIKNER